MRRHMSWLCGVMALLIAGLTMGCEWGGSSSTSEVALSPASAYLTSSEVSVLTFTASGGDSNYTWSVSDSSLGTLYAADETALYQSVAKAGTNTVWVSDSSGNTASATVVQE
jgi:hypothetical protein